MMRQLCHFVLKYRVFLSILLGGVTILAAFQLSKLKVNSEYSIWLNQDDPDLAHYSAFVKSFGTDETAILIYSEDNFFSNKGIAYLRKLTDKISEIEGLESVTSLATVNKLASRPMGVVQRPLLPSSLSDSAALKKTILDHPAYSDILITHNGKTLALIINLGDVNKRNKVYYELAAIRDEVAEEKGLAVLFGTIPIKVVVNDISRRETSKFVILAVVIISLLVLVIYRNLATVIIPVLTAIISIIWLLGLMATLGFTINLVLSILPLILLLISIAFGIHLITALGKQPQYLSKNERIRNAFVKVFPASALSGLTTVIAFTSFSFSEIMPIAHFGLLAATGVFFSLWINFLIIPILFSIHFPLFKDYEIRIRSVIAKQVSFQKKYARGIITLMSLVLCLAIVGITRLDVNTDQSKYLNKSHALRRQLEQADSLSKAIYPIEIIVEFPKSIFNYTDQELAALSSFETRVGQLELINKASVFTATLNYYKNQLGNRYSKEQILKLSQSSRIKKDFRFIDHSGKNVRLTVWSGWLGDQDTGILRSQIEELAKPLTETTGARITITGLSILYSSLSKKIVRGQIISMGLSFLLILGVFFVIFHDLKLAFLAIIPNVLPVILALGLMGWLGSSLDVVSSLMATVTLGIAVDDTIHFLKAFKDRYRKQGVEKAIIQSYEYCGLAITATTLILVAGFSVMLFSDYMPIRNLGFFIALSISLALLLDLVLLPVLLRKFSRLK